MNESSATPPVVPPIFPNPKPGPNAPLGESPEERVAIGGAWSALEAVLREPRRVLFQLRQSQPGPLILAMLGIALVCSLVYGFVVGTFSGGDQLWAAPVKLAGGLVLSALICLPSLYIFACLGGSQARLADVLGLVAGMLALSTLLLVGFAPVAWVFSQSTESVAMMGSLHLIFALIAVYFGLRLLHRGFVHFGADRDGDMKVWTAIFLLVALQMTTALRPIVGSATTFLPQEKKFFVRHWIDTLRGEYDEPKRTTAKAD